MKISAFASLCFLLSVLISGCTRTTDEQKQPEMDTESAVVIERAVEPEIKGSIAPKIFAQLPVTTADEIKNVPLKPLDLSLEGNFPPGANATIEDVRDKKILHDLFEKEKNKEQTILRGKLLRDEENEDYVDSIEGAEVDLEVRI